VIEGSSGFPSMRVLAFPGQLTFPIKEGTTSVVNLPYYGELDG
jgi:hypothetical protein